MLRIQSICHLGQDATINVVNGKSVINFSAAYSERFKNQDGSEVNNTIWLSCAYWTDKTNIASYLKKGIQIFLEGKPDVKIYNNKQGQQIPQLHVRVSGIKLLSSKDEQSKPQEQQRTEDTKEVDDLPF